MDKPVRCAVALVLRRQDHAFLAVRRPPDDDLLPNIWGLPAITLHEGELPESGARRVGREKLGIEVAPRRFVGIRSMDRGAYELILMDIEAGILRGEPDVLRAMTDSTRYVEQQWTTQPDLLIEAASRGSLCSRILLDEVGVSY